jgi:hypothetical protein
MALAKLCFLYNPCTSVGKNLRFYRFIDRLNRWLLISNIYYPYTLFILIKIFRAQRHLCMCFACKVSTVCARVQSLFVD